MFKLESMRLQNWKVGIKGLFWVTGIWAAFWGIGPMAGTATHIGIALDMPIFGFIDAGKAFLAALLIAVLGISIGAVGVAYGRKWKNLYESFLEERSSYIERLESELDPRRSSSQLTKKGRTRPEDL